MLFFLMSEWLTPSSALCLCPSVTFPRGLQVGNCTLPSSPGPTACFPFPDSVYHFIIHFTTAFTHNIIQHILFITCNLTHNPLILPPCLFCLLCLVSSDRLTALGEKGSVRVCGMNENTGFL